MPVRNFEKVMRGLKYLLRLFALGDVAHNALKDLSPAVLHDSAADLDWDFRAIFAQVGVLKGETTVIQ